MSASQRGAPHFGPMRTGTVKLLQLMLQLQDRLGYLSIGRPDIIPTDAELHRTAVAAD